MWPARRASSAFCTISTDEVGGSIPPGQFFREDSPLAPSSPYAASKAAAEHLVRAAAHTFGMDAVITRTSNNYGPYQFPEKLIPLAISNALRGPADPRLRRRTSDPRLDPRGRQLPRA